MVNAHNHRNNNIQSDIGGVDRWIWFVLANLLALAAVCPFVGSLSDLIGRRYVALVGATFLVIGMIVAGTAHSMNVFIGKYTPLVKHDIEYNSNISCRWDGNFWSRSWYQ